MIEQLKQFLVDEFNITFEQACAMSTEEKSEFFDKLAEIELEEITPDGNISERGRLATNWMDIMNTDPRHKV